MKRFLSLASLIFSLFLIPLSLEAQSTAPKQLLVQLNPELVKTREAGYDALKSLAAAARINSSSIHYEYIDFIQYHVLSLTDPAADAEAALQALRSADTNRLILNSEVSVTLQAQLTPNDSSFNEQWPLSGSGANIGAVAAWDINHSAPNVPIAIIDSGIDLTNSAEVNDNLADYYDFISNSRTAGDGFTHGTKIFGIIAAKGNNSTGMTGLVWDARVLSLRVLNNDGDASISLTLTAIGRAISSGAKIINLSWGYTPRQGEAPSAALFEALSHAREAGILVVCSAGNNGSDNDSTNKNYPSSYNLDNIIAVAASTTSDNLASFSNYGARSVHLSAPGTEIYSLLGSGYTRDRGTSFAAPYVTGTAALIWELKPALNYQQVKQLILDNVDAIPSLRTKTLSGGRLNVFKALQAAQGTVPAAAPANNNTTTSGGQNLTPDVNVTQAAPLTNADSSGNAASANAGSGGGCSLSDKTAETSANSFFYFLLMAGILVSLARVRKLSSKKI